jgi:hypothetical protein
MRVIALESNRITHPEGKQAAMKRKRGRSLWTK